MEAISIGASDQVDRIRQRLDCEFKSLADEGLDVYIDQKSIGNLTFLGCNLAPGVSSKRSPDEARLLFRHYVANALSDVILKDWEGSLLRKIIRSNYYYFDDEDQEKIFRYAVRNIAELAETGKSYVVQRKTRIIHKILDYLDGSNEFVLDGFVNFRLKEYVEELEEAVDKAVDDFLIEKEYREFIRLLKYFVEMQEPRLDRVHVVMEDSGSFRILDSRKDKVTQQHLEEFIEELDDGETDQDDMLISALITIAPRAIVLHIRNQASGNEAVNTIENVFSGRVSFCGGCELCR